MKFVLYQFAECIGVARQSFLIFSKFLQGHMQWLFDDKGRRYLDLIAGIVTINVGHSHP